MNEWSLTITAVATPVNALAVVVLVVITIWYARSANRQAKASEKQAAAAQSQATAAAATLNELRRQFYEQRHMDRALVQGAIDATIANVEHWLVPGPRRSLESAVRSHALPADTALLPLNSSEALECARRTSPELFLSLSGVFDQLRLATAEIDGLRAADPNWYRSDDFAGEVKKISGRLQGAREALQKLRTDIYGFQPTEPDVVRFS
jgi:hypothetical protein